MISAVLLLSSFLCSSSVESVSEDVVVLLGLRPLEAVVLVPSVDCEMEGVELLPTRLVEMGESVVVPVDGVEEGSILEFTLTMLKTFESSLIFFVSSESVGVCGKSLSVVVRIVV